MTYAAYSVLVDVGEMIAEFDTSSTGEVVLRRFLPANARTALKPMVGAVGSALEGYAAALPLALVKLIIMFATMFYCLTSGQAVEVYLRSIVPARLRPWLDVLWVPVSNVLRGMLYGHLVSSLILGALGGVGYAILGFQYAALLGALTAVAAMLPIVGPYAVFTPLAAAEFVTGSPLKAVAVLLYGIVVLTAYANFYMYPKLGGNYAGIHPLLVLIAFLAGPFAMGPTGLIFGPLAMGLAIGLAECVRLWSASARVEAATDHG
jgi:predicted PurR-regulated permease PerM